MSKYGLPYKGSKSSICDELLKRLPNAENFYDLFGGGGAVSHAAALSGKYKNVTYNEINPNVAKFIKDATEGKYSYENFKPEWVSREDFFSKKDKDAYVSLVWSFGNGESSYLYGKDIEKYKKSMHQAVIFDEFDELATQVLGINEWKTEVIKERRLILRKKIEHYRKTGIPSCLIPFLNKKQRASLNLYNKIEEAEALSGLPHLVAIERCDELNQLKQLHHLEGLERLNAINLIRNVKFVIRSSDYSAVGILPNSIVYCDIPYENTDGYSVEFNRSEFLDWAASASFPVYISEYSIQDPRFIDLWSTEKRSLQCGAIEGKEKVTERLYWNGN
jgi:hypothetical protein